MDWKIITTIGCLIFSAGATVGTWRVYVNHIKHLRIDVKEVFKRLDGIDKEISTVKEWQRIYEDKINKLNGK